MSRYAGKSDIIYTSDLQATDVNKYGIVFDRSVTSEKAKLAIITMHDKLQDEIDNLTHLKQTEFSKFLAKIGYEEGMGSIGKVSK